MRSGLKQLRHQFGACLDQVFAIVEDEQEPPLLRILDQRLDDRMSGLFLDAEHDGDRLRDESRVRTVGASSTNQTPSGKSSITSAASCCDSRVLPMPPAPDSVNIRVVRSNALHFLEFALPADKGGQLL